jgi:hypothetical protein
MIFEQFILCSFYGLTMYTVFFVEVLVASNRVCAFISQLYAMKVLSKQENIDKKQKNKIKQNKRARKQSEIFFYLKIVFDVN